MVGWRCNCIFCRLFVHPVLRRVGGLAVERRREAAVERVPVGGPGAAAGEESKGLGGAEPVAGGAGGVSAGAVDVDRLADRLAEVLSEQLGSAVSKLVEQVRGVFEESNKVLMERLDRVEENVGKLRKELQGLLNSMESIVVEFREALGELSNPLAAGQQVPAAASQVGAGGVADRVASVVRGILSIVDRAGIEAVEELVSEYRKAGLLDDREAAKLLAVAKVAAKLRERGVPGDVIASIVLQLLAGRGGGKGG